MVTYPIRVPWKHYRGQKPALREKAIEHNRTAQQLEAYINREFAESGEDVQSFHYYVMAGDLGLSTETVRDILFGVDCGSNGLTVRRPNPATGD